MKIKYLSTFRKHYKKRVQPYKGINIKFNQRVRIFIEDPKNPVIQDHQLTGKWRGCRAFWIAGDLRVIYKIEAEIIYFYDIGSHNQVY